MLKLPTLPKFCHKHKIISILGAILCVVLAVSLVQSQLMYTVSYGLPYENSTFQFESGNNEQSESTTGATKEVYTTRSNYFDSGLFDIPLLSTKTTNSNFVSDGNFSINYSNDNDYFSYNNYLYYALDLNLLPYSYIDGFSSDSGIVLLDHSFDYPSGMENYYWGVMSIYNWNDIGFAANGYDAINIKSYGTSSRDFYWSDPTGAYNNITWNVPYNTNSWLYSLIVTNTSYSNKVLDSIYSSICDSNVWLEGINGHFNTWGSSIQNINDNIGTISDGWSTLKNNISTISNNSTYLSTISSRLSTVNSNLDTVSDNIANLASYLGISNDYLYDIKDYSLTSRNALNAISNNMSFVYSIYSHLWQIEQILARGLLVNVSYDENSSTWSWTNSFLSDISTNLSSLLTAFGNTSSYINSIYSHLWQIEQILARGLLVNVSYDEDSSTWSFTNTSVSLLRDISSFLGDLDDGWSVLSILINMIPDISLLNSISSSLNTVDTNVSDYISSLSYLSKIYDAISNLDFSGSTVNIDLSATNSILEDIREQLGGFDDDNTIHSVLNDIEINLKYQGKNIGEWLSEVKTAIESLELSSTTVDGTNGWDAICSAISGVCDVLASYFNNDSGTNIFDVIRSALELLQSFLSGDSDPIFVNADIDWTPLINALPDYSDDFTNLYNLIDRIDNGHFSAMVDYLEDISHLFTDSSGYLNDSVGYLVSIYLALQSGIESILEAIGNIEVNFTLPSDDTGDWLDALMAFLGSVLGNLLSDLFGSSDDLSNLGNDLVNMANNLANTFPFSLIFFVITFLELCSVAYSYDDLVFSMPFDIPFLSSDNYLTMDFNSFIDYADFVSPFVIGLVSVFCVLFLRKRLVDAYASVSGGDD